MDEGENRRTLERFWRAHQAGDPAALAAELHPELVAEWPQSGERVRGRANMDAINRAFPGGHPTARLRRLLVRGDLGILELVLDYGGEVYHACEILELKDGKVYRATEYFGAPSPAPAWRARWVERLEEPPATG